MRTFTVSPADDGTRISRYVQKIAPGTTESGLYKAFRKNAVKINGKKCEASDKVNKGDIVTLFLPDDCFPLINKRPDFMSAGKEINILYEDENIALLYKPEGLNSHPVKGEYGDNLISRFLRYLYEKGEFSPDESVFTPALCNRLDRNTDGIVIAGKTREAVSAGNDLIKNGCVIKKYIAVCCGTPPTDGIYTAYHLKKENNTALISNKMKDGYKEIITEFHILKTEEDLCLIEVTLHTGRSHQIRAHLAHLGCPILGDPKYGNLKINKEHAVKSQCLTAYSVSFEIKENSLLSYLSGRNFTIGKIPYTDMFS